MRPNRPRPPSSIVCLSLFFVLLLLAPLAPAVGAQGWSTERVDGAKTFGWMTHRSLALDAQGRPHIAYGYDHLYYAVKTGGQWQIDTLDTQFNAGGSASLLLDRDGYPRITYQANDGVRYIYRDARGWHNELIDPQGVQPSMALDGSDRPHVAYAISTLELRYAYRDPSSGWRMEAALPSLSLRNWCLAVTAEGDPLIAYAEKVSPSALKIARRMPWGWSSVVIDDSGDMGSFISLALGAGGEAHLAYSDRGNKRLNYARQEGLAWAREVVDTDSQGADASIFLDAAGWPHISYRGGVDGALKYAYRDVTGWRVHYVDTDKNVGGYSSLVVDGAGRAHISYYDYARSALKYALGSPSAGWQIEFVDRGGEVGRYTSLQTDAERWPHIAYYRERALYYARRVAFVWDIRLVDNSGDVGRGASLALDAQGYAHIGYYDAANGALKYARQDRTGWHIAVLDDNGDTGLYPSLALDAAQSPHITYYDATRARIRYGHYTNDEWTAETVGSSGPGAERSSLVLDGAGYPHIAYQKTSGYPDCTLYYRRKNASGWRSSQVGEGPYFGDFPSLKLDAAGRPHIAFGRTSLQYARQTSDGWEIIAVDAAPSHNVGAYASMDLDAFGYPHIGYWDETEGDVKYASQDASGWHIAWVDTDRSVGEYLSLDLDSLHGVHISYYDSINGDLKYAYDGGRPLRTLRMPLATRP